MMSTFTSKWSTAEWNAFITGLCFFLVFSGWSAVSNIATSTHGYIGSYSLSIVYLTLTVSNLITAKLVSKYSPKYIMLFGSLSYCLYIAVNAFDASPFILYIASFLVGIGAASIWVAQQLFITQCSNCYEIQNNLEMNSKLGYFNGLFFMIYSFKKIIGPIIGAVSLTFGASVSFMYCILTLLCFAGTFGFSLLKPMIIKNSDTTKINKSDDDDEEVVNLLTESNLITQREYTSDNISEMSLTQSIYKIFELWKDGRLWYLVPYTIYIGMDASFVSGVYPLLISETKNKFFIVSYCGIILAITSMIVGKLSDKIGRLFVLMIAGFCEMIVYFYIYVNVDGDAENIKVPILHSLVLGTLIGISSAGYLTQISAMYPIVLKSRNAEIFANLKLFQSFSQAIAFYIQPMISIPVLTQLNFTLLVCGLLPLIAVQSIREDLQKAKL